MLDHASKAFFHLLAQSGTLKAVASRFGMRKPTSFARRFIAGETVGEAIQAARAVAARGLPQTPDFPAHVAAPPPEAAPARRADLSLPQPHTRPGPGPRLRGLGLDVSVVGIPAPRPQACWGQGGPRAAA